jgi:hypothetical protein
MRSWDSYFIEYSVEHLCIWQGIDQAAALLYTWYDPSWSWPLRSRKALEILDKYIIIGNYLPSKEELYKSCRQETSFK